MSKTSKDELLSSYDFHLPPELIAQRPMRPRSLSRLLVYRLKTGEVSLDTFDSLPKYLPSESTLIFNKTKVYPARLLAEKSTGAKGEIFLLSQVESKGSYPCLLGFSGSKKVGLKLLLGECFSAEITSVADDGIFYLKFSHDLSDLLKVVGRVPIPPYIRKGLSDEQDLEDYQTVYAKETGSVAAPTAGLHFDSELLTKLDQTGISMASLCLHVGMGTFAPVKTENISDHEMHSEHFFIEDTEWKKIQQAKIKIAVGTTSLRALESVYLHHHNKIEANISYATNIFIKPGYEIKSVDGLITNFHLPKSSLLMLVSALMGREKLLELYELAIKEKFRFYSYGDAMCVLP